LRSRLTPASCLFPYTTLFRSGADLFGSPGGDGTDQIRVLSEALLRVGLHRRTEEAVAIHATEQRRANDGDEQRQRKRPLAGLIEDRKSTRLNCSHQITSYAVV